MDIALPLIRESNLKKSIYCNRITGIFAIECTRSQASSPGGSGALIEVAE
jgi:hypothetical protein